MSASTKSAEELEIERLQLELECAREKIDLHVDEYFNAHDECERYEVALRISLIERKRIVERIRSLKTVIANKTQRFSLGDRALYGTRELVVIHVEDCPRGQYVEGHFVNELLGGRMCCLAGQLTPVEQATK